MIFVETIPNKNSGVTEIILEDLPNNKVRVKFTIPSWETYSDRRSDAGYVCEDVISRSFLRNRSNRNGLLLIFI